MLEAGIARRLRVTGIVAVVTIALVAIVQTAALEWRFSGAPIRTDTVNRSGLRRAETFAVLYRAERAAARPSETPQLDRATDALVASQAQLNDLSSAEQALFDRFVADARAIAKSPRATPAGDLETLGPTLFETFDELTASYASNGASQRRTFYLFVLAGGTVILVAIALLYFLVMRPREGGIVAAISALEERRRRFAAIFDNSSELMALYKPDGSIVRANRAALERLGFGTEVVGKHFGVHVAQRDRPEAEKEFVRAAAGEAREFAAAFIDSQGREIPVLAHLTPIVVGKRVVGVAGSARDVAREREFEGLLLRSRERFRSLFKLSTHAIASVDAEGVVTDMNPAMAQLTGYDAAELVGQTILTLSPPGARSGAAARLGEILAGKAMTYETRIRTRSGTEVAAEADVTPIVVAGTLEGSFITLRDKTAERAMRRRLDEKDVLVRALLEVAGSSFEPAARIDFALAAGTRALGLEYAFLVRTRGDLITVEHRFGPDDFMPVGHTMPPTRTVGERLASTVHAVAIDDLTVEPYAAELLERGLPWKSYIGSRISVDGKPYGALVFLDRRVREPHFEQAHVDFVDVLASQIASEVARESQEHVLRDRAIHDPLTGLPNRSLLEEHFARMIARARRDDGAVAIHYIDLDGFKPVNDVHGHAAGDEVLRVVARRFLHAARGEDVVARLGGDEFVVLQTDANESAVASLSARLEASLALPVPLPDGASVHVGASLGVGRYPGDGADLAAILEAADAHMYRLKRAKRAT